MTYTLFRWPALTQIYYTGCYINFSVRDALELASTSLVVESLAYSLTIVGELFSLPASSSQSGNSKRVSSENW